MATENTTEVGGSNFIRQIIEEDLHTGKHDGRVVTRFPPEPNGYLHIGHAKSIVLNFGIARDYQGQCHLRFDDTNPLTEDVEYVESIKDAVRWLGYDWGEHIYFASDYFEQFYQYALKLIRDGKAYVDSLSEDEISEYRGTVTEPGRPSPDRDRPIEENLDLFQRMRAGEFEDGEYVLRAIIDLESPNMKMRDPLLYRIKHAEHYRAGDEWPIYPMYDFAHCLEDAIEDVTHSLCTLEFDNNRELYDWVLDNCLEPEELPQRPHQYEFARLNLDYTVMSKRKLLRLVNEGLVGGWDDPRLPTIAGLRRRGVTPGAIRTFCEKIGVTRAESRVEMRYFEETVRDVLNTEAPRVMAVVNPLKVVVTNFPEGETDWLDADYWPRDIPKNETREVPFTRELFIERDDFMEEPTKKFYRLAPEREVRLRYGYFITCDEVVKDDDGNVVELRCSYDPETRGGDAPDGRSPKGTIHWVSAEHGLPAEIRLYDRLFDVDDPDGGEEDFAEHLNPGSLATVQGVVEPSVANDEPQTRYQFERQGYFWRDPVDARPDALVFNRIVPLRDTWSKIAKEVKKEQPRPKPKKQRPAPQPPVEQRDPVEDLGPRQLERFERLHEDVGLDRDDAAILAQEVRLTDFFDQARAAYDAPQPLANWIVNELLRELKDRTLTSLPFTPAQFAALVRLTDTDVINSRAGREVFDQMLSEGGDPEAIVEERGLRQIEDRGALEDTVDQIIADHPDEVGRYREGKRGLIGFFMGRVMQATRGKANPELAREVLQEKLGG